MLAGGCVSLRSGQYLTVALTLWVLPQIFCRGALPRAPSEVDVTGEQLAAVLLECVEACIHYTLCARELYPPQAFELCRLYGLAVRRCRHPQVVSYVHDLLQSLKPLLFTGELEEIWLVVQDSSARPCERYIFSTSLPRSAANGQTDAALPAEKVMHRVNLALLEGELRTILAHLIRNTQTSGQMVSKASSSVPVAHDPGLRRALTPGCTYEVVAKCRQGPSQAGVALADTGWCVASVCAQEEAGDVHEIRDAYVTPVAALPHDAPISLQLILETLP
eukprot:scaffold3296_cov405-Prasinococcus_capsulatus_cf.AAC.21